MTKNANQPQVTWTNEALTLVWSQWRSYWGGQGGRVPPPTVKNLPKIRKKREKEGENQEKLGKKRKNQEEKAKIGKVLSLCPSWQIELATLLSGAFFPNIFSKGGVVATPLPDYQY